MSVAPAHSSSNFVERLAEFDSLRAVPESERAWLVANGEHRVHEAGEVILTPADEAREMIVQLSGRIVVYFGHGAGRRHSAQSKAGSITGLLPFSRLKRPPSDVLVEERTELIAIHQRQFPEMIRECPVLVESLVHNMVDRARRFAAADWEDEKLLSLGRLAAGLAHELNNPASAASSCASRLAMAIHDVGVSACQLGEATLDTKQRALVVDMVDAGQLTSQSAPRDTLDRLDREDAIAAWLARHNCNVDVAASLVNGGVTIDSLNALAASIPEAVIPRAIHWLAAASSAVQVVVDLQHATRRIHELVTSVRGFTHMDRAAIRAPIEIAPSLKDTFDVLVAEANAESVGLTLDVPANLPAVLAVAPDLNQVWLHLITNAMDAAGAKGRVHVGAERRGSSIIVSVVDDGPGIAPEIQPRIFDPFFTTKAVGKGVGLGLDIVRRTVSEFGGEVEFDSTPGRTEFRVRLPAVEN